jgi:hypothetical protein
MHLHAGAALDRMIAAVKPGGWLLIEDFDAPSGGPQQQMLRISAPSGRSSPVEVFKSTRGARGRPAAATGCRTSRPKRAFNGRVDRPVPG